MTANISKKNVKPIILLYAILPSLSIGLLNGFYSESIYALDPVWFWIFDITQFVIIPMSVFYTLARYGGIRPSRYGFSSMEFIDYIGLTVFITFIYWITYNPLSALLSWLFKSNTPDFTYASVIPKSVILHLVVVIYFSATAAIVEEIVYRAIPWLYFSTILGKKYRVWFYVISSSTLFGLIHWENGIHEVVSTSFLGILACVLYVKIRNIWPLVSAHFFIDIISFW